MYKISHVMIACLLCINCFAGLCRGDVQFPESVAYLLATEHTAMKYCSISSLPLIILQKVIDTYYPLIPCLAHTADPAQSGREKRPPVAASELWMDSMGKPAPHGMRPLFTFSRYDAGGLQETTAMVFAAGMLRCQSFFWVYMLLFVIILRRCSIPGDSAQWHTPGRGVAVICQPSPGGWFSFSCQRYQW